MNNNVVCEEGTAPGVLDGRLGKVSIIPHPSLSIMHSHILTLLTNLGTFLTLDYNFINCGMQQVDFYAFYP